MRDNVFLENRLYEIWESFFADVPRKNLVLIHFGKFSARQLGCIKWADKKTKIKQIYRKHTEEHKAQDETRISVITITRYFQDLTLPEHLIDSTIAHELVHYAHGFNSPLPRLYEHPHKGNIVGKELKSRGLGNLHSESKKWLRENWRNYLRKLQSQAQL